MHSFEHYLAAEPEREACQRAGFESFGRRLRRMEAFRLYDSDSYGAMARGLSLKGVTQGVDVP